MTKISFWAKKPIKNSKLPVTKEQRMKRVEFIKDKEGSRISFKPKNKLKKSILVQWYISELNCIGKTYNKKRCRLTSMVLIMRGVILCCNDFHSKYKFGNINRESLLDIWGKKEFVKLGRDLARCIFRLNLCKKCQFGTL